MVIMMNLLAKRIKHIQGGKPMIKQLPMYLLLLLCGLLLITPDGRAGEADQKFTSGMYEGLMLAVDDKGELLGYFEQSLGAVNVTCAFLLKGKDSNGQASIVTWSDQLFEGGLDNPEKYFFPGLLRRSKTIHGKDAVNIKVEQGHGHPGCSMTIGPQIGEEGISLSRNYEAKWVSLKLVKSKRTSLFSAPSIDKKTKAYFISRDVLGVLAVNGDWINVEFPRDGKKMIKGWVRSDDVEDLQPPQKK